VVREFEKKYGVKVNYQTGSGHQHAECILARRPGRHTADAWIGGDNTRLTQLLPNGVLQSFPALLVEPKVKNPSNWFQEKHGYTNPESRHIFTWGAKPQHVVFINTDMVKPEEIRPYPSGSIRKGVRRQTLVWAVFTSHHRRFGAQPANRIIEEAHKCLRKNKTSC
jgi:ABC-type Fe3+ transport system substrate-binding protein